MTLDLVFLYNNPAVLYAVAGVALTILVIRIWGATDRKYTERAEAYLTNLKECQS